MRVGEDLRNEKHNRRIESEQVGRIESEQVGREPLIDCIQA